MADLTGRIYPTRLYRSKLVEKTIILATGLHSSSMVLVVLLLDHDRRLFLVLLVRDGRTWGLITITLNSAVVVLAAVPGFREPSLR